MPRPIGYYVHHQGAGHLHRARLIAGALKRPCTFIGTFAENPGGDHLALPDDRLDHGFAGTDGECNRPHAMHYAPLGHAGVRARMAAIAAWVSARDPALLVVDVSVEIALFARLLSVPVVIVRLAGRRDDTPHLEAFRAAEALLAPFPATFDRSTLPAWVKAKTIYVGFLASPDQEAPRGPAGREIAVVLGRGGDPADATCFVEAAHATPGWTWIVHGIAASGHPTLPSNLRMHGWTPDIDAALDRAEIVIGGCGDGLLAAVAAKGKRFICLPEPRPYDEQVDKARVLQDLGLAIVLTHWPDASHWPDILQRASQIDVTPLRALYDPNAVAATAAAIDAIADRFDPRRGYGK